jgi:DNA adenine methylase
MTSEIREIEEFKLTAETSQVNTNSRLGVVKPPFGYFGAKNRIAGKIVSILPPHNAWVEAFCGSAAVTLAKKPVEIEVINDLDGQVVNLFQILRERPDDLRRVLQLTPYAREEYELARKKNS